MIHAENLGSNEEGKKVKALYILGQLVHLLRFDCFDFLFSDYSVLDDAGFVAERK